MPHHINVSIPKVLEQLQLTTDVEQKRVLLHKVAAAYLVSDKATELFAIVNNEHVDYNDKLKSLLYKEIINAFASHPNKRYLCIHTRNVSKCKVEEEFAFGTSNYHFLRPNMLVVDLQTLNIINTIA